MDFRLDDAIPILERTPGTLRAMLTGLPEPWLRHNEGGETWSPFEVVGHLISGEESDWIPRAKIVLVGGPNPVFPPFDRLRHLTAYASMGLAERLDRFEAARRESLAALRGFELTPAHLAMTGIHPEFGRVTLAQHLSTWTVHDLTHLAQIVRVMAKQYGEAVGPWTKYLSVLQG